MKKSLFTFLIALFLSFVTVAQVTESSVEIDSTPPGNIAFKNYQSVQIENKLEAKEEEKKEEPASAGPTPFGKTFTHKTGISSTSNDIIDVELLELKPKYAKEHYNSLTNNDLFIEENLEKKVLLKSRIIEGQYVVMMPALKANRFYKLKVRYVSNNNLLKAFLLMHEEKNTDWEVYENEWMQMIQRISKNEAPFHLKFYPSLKQLNDYKSDVDSYLAGRSILTLNDTVPLRSKTLKNFPILKLKHDSVPTNKQIMDFAQWAATKETFTQYDVKRFDIFTKEVKGFISRQDYLALYQFYDKIIKTTIEDLYKEYTSNGLNSIDIESIRKEDYIKFNETVKPIIENEIRKAKLARDGPVPNYLLSLKSIIENRSAAVSTYSENFETSYKRSLVPDFGILGYSPPSTSIRGVPYVGVHLSLQPVNKNIPLKLSQLTFWQRTSAHIGITLTSIEEDGLRDDFFDKVSLMFGGGYKFGTQATRLNYGIILYNKLDAISSDPSFAITPYFGISIDLEIRKWLEEAIPSFTNNFKKS